MSDIISQTLTSLVKNIKEKKLSSEEVTKAFVNRSEKSKELNVYITEDFSNAIDKAKEFDEKQINSSGIYYFDENKKIYLDRFRNRIIFPVKSLNGSVLALGGRALLKNTFAKYINSPETEFYKKGNMIFNLDKAKDLRSTTDEVLIVEGYMDVVSVYASGIKNVISNSGTALTERQINLIWKFFSNPIICLDGDESGQKAALRIAERLFTLINEKNKI